MSDSVETALIRTLTEAAEAAPEPPVDLIHNVDTGFRRRRRRRYSLIAGVAAFAVITGSAIWAGNTFVPQPDLQRTPVLEPAPPAPLAKPGNGAPDPVSKVWPEAYHTIPSKLPDGHKLTPQQMIDDREVLANTDASFENADRLWAVDVHTGETRLVTRLPQPHRNRESFASHFTVGSGQVVWMDSYSTDGRHYTRIWKVPVRGGQPQLVTTAPGKFGTMGDRLVIHQDLVYISSSMSGGVWKVPLAGGDTQFIKGTETYQIVSWPWVARPGECDNWPPSPGESCGGTSATRVFTEVMNLHTGARYDMTMPYPDLLGIHCTVSYCLAYQKKNRKDYPVVFTRDGRLVQSLPAFGGILRDRFLLLCFQRNGNCWIQDLISGRHADLGTRRGVGGVYLPMYWDPDSRLIFWPVDKKRSYAILDLGAIE